VDPFRIADAWARAQPAATPGSMKNPTPVLVPGESPPDYGGGEPAPRRLERQLAVTAHRRRVVGALPGWGASSDGIVAVSAGGPSASTGTGTGGVAASPRVEGIHRC